LKTEKKGTASKGERTRAEVVEQAAALFNQHGYQGASISDIMLATGLKKGGIYRHFTSKEELSLEAFHFAAGKLSERFEAALAGKSSARERLRAIVNVYARIPIDPPVPGGCPLLNAAVEADDGNPELRKAAQGVMKGLLQALRGMLRDGQKAGELRRDLDVEASAHVLVAQLEGAVMLARLYGSQAPMRHTLAHLERWLETL
jgi:TetR/AcrR family transcriptional regulator, transcriptional repressor for nem operon